jgi:hypothetical protein
MPIQNTTKETVTEHTADGSSSVARESSTDTQTQTIANVIYFIAGLFEVALAFRFILKLTGANPNSGFVAGIYSFTQFLILPFNSIFASRTAGGVGTQTLFEPGTLIAILVYAVLAWGLVRLVAIASGNSSQEL